MLCLLVLITCVRSWLVLVIVDREVDVAVRGRQATNSKGASDN